MRIETQSRLPQELMSRTREDEILEGSYFQGSCSSEDEINDDNDRLMSDVFGADGEDLGSAEKEDIGTIGQNGNSTSCESRAEGD